MTITGDHLFALIALLVLAVIEVKAWRASRRAQAEQDERDARYIMARLTQATPQRGRREYDRPRDLDQVHALVRDVLDDIPGFDEYFDRTGRRNELH